MPRRAVQRFDDDGDGEVDEGCPCTPFDIRIASSRSPPIQHLGPTPRPRFSARYGAAKELQLCSSTPTNGTFYVDTAGGSCGDLCAGLGGTCVEAYDGDCGNISSTVRACTLGDQVCNCRP